MFDAILEFLGFTASDVIAEAELPVSDVAETVPAAESGPAHDDKVKFSGGCPCGYAPGSCGQSGNFCRWR